MKEFQPKIHALLLILAAPAAGAHSPDAAERAPTLATAWTFDPWLMVPLAAAAMLYALGAVRTWGAQAPWRAASFAAGMLLVLLALVWPLDALGEWSLAAHMAQHMVLLAAAPPLLVLARPGPVLLAALPARTARAVVRPWRTGAGRASWNALANPGVAMLLQITVMWGWHAPAALDAALRHDALHIAMHVSFLAVGLLFWTAVTRAVRDPGMGFGAAAAALAGTMIQMGLLSALLTFGTAPRFTHYLDRAPALGLSPLADQQLAGLIMWVPGAVPYVAGAIALVAFWLARAERFDRPA